MTYGYEAGKAADDGQSRHVLTCYPLASNTHAFPRRRGQAASLAQLDSGGLVGRVGDALMSCPAPRMPRDFKAMVGDHHLVQISADLDSPADRGGCTE